MWQHDCWTCCHPPHPENCFVQENKTETKYSLPCHTHWLPNSFGRHPQSKQPFRQCLYKRNHPADTWHTQTNTNVKLDWIPGHANHKCNELADLLAKNAAHSQAENGSLTCHCQKIYMDLENQSQNTPNFEPNNRHYINCVQDNLTTVDNFVFDMWSNTSCYPSGRSLCPQHNKQARKKNKEVLNKILGTNAQFSKMNVTAKLIHNVTYPQIKRFAKSRVWDWGWQNQWENGYKTENKNNAAFSKFLFQLKPQVALKPAIEWHINFDRRMEVVFTRLRLNNCSTNKPQYYVTKRGSKYCNDCEIVTNGQTCTLRSGVEDSVEHRLFDCPKHSAQRDNLRSEFMEIFDHKQLFTWTNFVGQTCKNANQRSQIASALQYFLKETKIHQVFLWDHKRQQSQLQQ